MDFAAVRRSLPLRRGAYSRRGLPLLLPPPDFYRSNLIYRTGKYVFILEATLTWLRMCLNICVRKSWFATS